MREAFRRSVEALEGLGAHVFVSHRAHFLDPLDGEDWAALADCDALVDEAVLRVVEEVLPRHAPGARALDGAVAGSRRPVIFFPVPMARALFPAGAASGARHSPEAAAEERAVVDRFHYDLIHVDAEQRWSWRGRPVGERARRFFLEHARWFERASRWGFEYKVHDGWWDKSYLDAEVTPLVAIRLEELAAERRAVAHLASGQAAEVDLESFRLDERERLFCRTRGLGEVMLSDTVRFQVASTVSEDLATVEVAGVRWALRWPEGGVAGV